jgi:hypothetical protein
MKWKGYLEKARISSLPLCSHKKKPLHHTQLSKEDERDQKLCLR